MSKLQEESTQQAKLVDQVANLHNLQDTRSVACRNHGGRNDTQKTGVSLSYMHLKQVEKVMAQSQEIH